MRPLVVAGLIAIAAAGTLHAQARSAPDWTTQGGDAQRTSWMPVDPYISIQSLSKFQFIWKLKLDNESRHGHSLTAPVALGNLMTFRGFKSLIFVGGSSNNVYAIDYDFGTLFWRTHHNYTAGPREYAGSPMCPGGMTLPLTRATNLTPPSQLSFFGFARPPRPAKGAVGEPGKGAPQLAEIAARQAARLQAASAEAPRATADGSTSAAPPVRTSPPNFVFSVAADGLLRGLIPDTGDLALAPTPFLPPNATATGLLWADGFVYAATANTCGGAATAVFAMDFDSPAKPVVRWESDEAPVKGLAVGPDGTVFITTGGGPSRYANSVIALEGRTLKLKDWMRHDSAFLAAPVVFTEADRTYVAAATGGRFYVLDAESLGGADHRTPLYMSTEAGSVRFSDGGLATWRDPAGTRWILGEVSGAIAAFRLVDAGGRPSFERAWTSMSMPSPGTPMIVNGVVFALASGTRGANAVLYALDPTTGKDLWSSGATMTAAASGGLSTGTGQVYVVTQDNTVWAFGIPLAID